jgi:hypothetical protein
MLKLNQYLVALILWLAFLFNIERLDLEVRNTEVFNIASPVYVVTLAVVLLGVLLPQVRRIHLWHMHLTAGLLFVVTMWFDGRAAWGGIQTYLTLFEFAAVLLSVTLATLVGQASADFLESARALLLSGTDGRIYQGPQAASVIKREMHFARRANRPLSVMVLDTEEDSKPVRLHTTTQEIQRILASRYKQVSLARLLARIIRRTDFLVDESEDGRLILVMPEMTHEQTTAIVERLNQQVQERLGSGLRYGVASLPEQGVTFEELVYQAEYDSKSKYHGRFHDRPVVEHSGTTEKMQLIEAGMHTGDR